jgi:Domain of unknown function (DUF1905)
MSSAKIPAVRFRGVIKATGRGGAAVTLPFDPELEFGKARAPIRGTVNGAPFRSTVAIYGGVAYLGLTKAQRQAAGAEIGDAVDLEIELDETPREVDVPPELAAVLKRDPEAARVRQLVVYASEGVRALDRRSEACRDEATPGRASGGDAA